MAETTQPGKLLLRAAPAIATLAGQALGLDLPNPLNTARRNANLNALRLGPDEYLLILPRADLPTTHATLKAALAHHHHALVDLSARLSTLTLTGPAARETLAAACPLDLHPIKGQQAFDPVPEGNTADRPRSGAFGPNQATRTLLGKAEIILDCQAPDHFHLHTNRSLTPYTQTLLTEAAREHGPAVTIEVA